MGMKIRMALSAMVVGLSVMGAAWAVEKAPIKIGAILAVTGPAANLGAPEARTAQMLVEAINARGGIQGHPVKLIVRFRRQPREGGLVRQAVD